MTDIGKWAFSNTGLTSITIPSSVTGIGEYVFGWCDKLTSVTISEGVSDIGYCAFLYSGLTSITIPLSVTGIGEYAFGWCDKLTSVTISEGVSDIGNHAFIYSGLTSVTIPSSVARIGEGAFSSCSNLTSVHIPEGVTDIGTGVFAGCPALTAITVDERNPAYCSVDSILFNKSRTTLVEFPAGKTDASYTIPSTVTAIGKRAFSDCNKLTSVTIPGSVTRIDWWAFISCTDLKSISCEGATPPALPSPLNTYNPFSDLNTAACTLYVPSGAAAAYQAAGGWNEFNIVEGSAPVVAEPSQPEGDRGTIDVSLNVPTGEPFTVTFTVTLPAGFTLNLDLTALPPELLSTHQLIITPLGANSWTLEIKPKTSTRAADGTTYRQIVQIAYTMDKSVTKGDYEAKLTDLDLTLNSGEVVHQDEINVPVTVASSVNNVTVEAPAGRIVAVYSLAGQLVAKAPAGQAIEWRDLPKGQALILVTERGERLKTVVK
jgi:hypothetical protein